MATNMPSGLFLCGEGWFRLLRPCCLDNFQVAAGAAGWRVWRVSGERGGREERRAGQEQASRINRGSDGGRRPHVSHAAPPPFGACVRRPPVRVLPNETEVRRPGRDRCDSAGGAGGGH